MYLASASLCQKSLEPSLNPMSLLFCGSPSMLGCEVEHRKKQFSVSYANMEKSKPALPRMMAPAFLLGLIFMLRICPTSVAQDQNFQETEVVPTEELEEEQSKLLTYIVHVKKPPQAGDSLQTEDLHSWYHSFLPINGDETRIRRRMIFSYRNVVTGFAAKLTAEEAEALQEKDDILLAWPERILSLHTTHTPSFLKLQQGLGLWKDSNFGEGIIIGVVDTGINPTHPSFSGEGMPAPPAKWKGICEFNGQRTCNNKLIGARNLIKSTTLPIPDPPYDDNGHGTHTASTAAGKFVEDASFFGNAKGTAVGIAPHAHLAIYKVCNSKGCSESATLAAIDAAIEDGVDILSLSLGGDSDPFFTDPIALGAFSAMQKGIFVSCSADNRGPAYGTLSNEAPWILTVGASTTDRKILATTKLGNGAEYDGESLFQPNHFSSELLPLVYAGSNGKRSSAHCAPGSLENVDVKGKVVLCELGGYGTARFQKGQEVKNAGGAAMILMNTKMEEFNPYADVHVLPAVHVSRNAGLAIKDYINSTSTPTATILFKGTVIGNSLAPSVTSFSSRGPCKQSPGILKPDIIGPGMSILAPWRVSLDNHTPPFNIISGTSMSCPHLSGIAALIKSAHTDWSPAAIKSAIMTTADKLNLGGKPILDERHVPADIFATGAGHVNPVKANDPGLIYDLQPDDYIPYLCGLGYTDGQIAVIVQRRVKCCQVKSIMEAQLNYPSISVQLGSTSQLYTRTLTNVGPAKVTYRLELNLPSGVDMSVNPSTIIFTALKQQITYSIEFIPQHKNERANHTFSQGSLNWVSEKHSVSIPISVIFKN